MYVCMTDIRYFDSSGDTVRTDPKSTYSFAQIFALTRSETRDSRSKVTLENVSSGFSVGKVSLPTATVFVNASISFDAASSTTVGWSVDWVFVPESLSAGARFVWTMPTDCKAPEIAREIISPSSVGLNCEEDSSGCVELSGRAVEIGRLSARRCFGATAGAGLFTAWRFEARLGGILMKNVHYITPTAKCCLKIKTGKTRRSIKLSSNKNRFCC